MNYTRRANRPDANYYRDARRRRLKKRDVHPGSSEGRGWLLPVVVLVIVAGAGFIGWMIWRGV